MPDDVTPAPAPAAFLSPAMKRYLLLIGVSLASLFIGRLLPGWTPPPPPDDLFKRLDAMQAKIERMDGNVQEIGRSVDVIQGVQALDAARRKQ